MTMMFCSVCKSQMQISIQQYQYSVSRLNRPTTRANYEVRMNKVRDARQNKLKTGFQTHVDQDITAFE